MRGVSATRARGPCPRMGGATGVMLWATERETSEALESDLGALRQTLAATGLRAGAVIVRHGEPPMQAAAASGHFLDART